MRQGGERRDTVFPWGNTPADVSGQDACRFAVGDTVFNKYVPPSRGTVTAVDEETATMGVKWDDGSYPITYPIDASYLRKAFPWE